MNLDDLLDRIRRRGGRWREVADAVARTRVRMQEDRVLIVAAGLAFYGMLAVIPAAVAVVSLYSLIGDPAELTRQVERLTHEMPDEVERLIVGQLLVVANLAEVRLGLWLLVALVLWLWSASRGVKALVQALNIVYGVEEDRGAAQRRLVSLAVTGVGIVVATLGLGVVEALIRALDTSSGLALAVRLARWPVSLVIGTVVLAGVYRYAPNREAHDGWRWYSVGAAVATGVWALASAGFLIYVIGYGDSSRTYGALGMVLALQLWMFVSAFAVLLGAYLDVELSGDGGRSGARAQG